MREGSRAQSQASVLVLDFAARFSLLLLLTFCNIKGSIGLTNLAGLTISPRSDQPGAPS